MADKIQKKTNVNILTKKTKKMKKVNELTKKKAQISTFIILGLLAFLIFGFLFYVMKSTTEKIAQDSAQDALTKLLEKIPLESYVTLCLDRSLKQALTIIGKQGGYIYKNQPGSIIPFDVDTINYQGNKISYLIEPTPARPPWYPCFTQDDPPVYCAFINDIGDFNKYIFGTSKLPFLYKSQGLYSIQRQLESYVSTQTKICTNFTGLMEKEEFEFYNITEGNISAEIFFHEFDTSIILEYPLIIQIPNNPAETKLLEFKSTAKVRFRKVYDAVKEIIQKDNNFLDFNIIKDTELGFYKEEELKFSALIPDAHIQKKIINTFDDVIIINDSLSGTNGDNYIFQFARKNRYPVLDYINISIVEEDKAITINPKAKDPDEDLLSFNLSGNTANKFKFIGNDTYKYTPPSPTEGAPLPVGYYPFNLSASDSQLLDYQIVEILVCNLDLSIGQDQKCDKRCGADSKCHLKSVSSSISSCDFGSTYLTDECSGSCQLRDGNICGSLSTSATCTSDSECDSRQQYAAKSNGWCYGIDGCELFCATDLVDLNNNFNTTFPQGDIGDECGCTPSNKGARCYKKPYLNPNDIYYCREDNTCQ